MPFTLPTASTEEIIHVAGPGLVMMAGGGQTSPTLKRLGMTQNGVTIEPVLHQMEVFTDFFGSQLPADYVRLGAMAIVRFTLVQWDATQLAIFRGGMRGRLGNATSSDDIGRMIIAGKRYFEVYIPSAKRTGGRKESPYRFQTFIPFGSTPEKLGTRHSQVDLMGIAHPGRTGFAWVRS